MASRSDELQNFKRIDLVQYAVSRGFSIDRRASSKASIVVRHPCGDKLIISRDPSGVYFYFNAKGNDKGTIIDLIQSLDGGSIGDVRKTLRGYKPSEEKKNGTAVHQTVGRREAKDSSTVKNAWQNAKFLKGRNSYLTDCRSIPETVYLDERFAGRFKIDARGNILAAHHDRDGLCGFEMKNGTDTKTTFTGFSPGGTKGLFFSKKGLDDRIVVLTETFIDALSVATITGVSDRRFFSLGGNPSPAQMELLESAINKLANGPTVEMRFDHDEAGLKLAAKVREEILATATNVKSFRSIHPPEAGTDWNDFLRKSKSLGCE